MPHIADFLIEPSALAEQLGVDMLMVGPRDIATGEQSVAWAKDGVAGSAKVPDLRRHFSGPVFDGKGLLSTKTVTYSTPDDKARMEWLFKQIHGES